MAHGLHAYSHAQSTMVTKIEPTIKIARDALENRVNNIKNKPDAQPETSIFANGCFWG